MNGKVSSLQHVNLTVMVLTKHIVYNMHVRGSHCVTVNEVGNGQQKQEQI